MILDFRGKEYKCSYYAGNYFYENMVCFSRGCSQGEFNGYYYATIIWPRSRQVQLNYCTFDTKTLIEYFKEISRLLGFTLISLVKSTHSYKLQIRCAPDNRFFVYSAMYIRYVYENPFWLLLYSAWQNRANFPELDITQIMQLYITLFHDGRRCHCPGLDDLTFHNINPKCQFNLIRENFNYSGSFCRIIAKHNSLCHLLRVFNSKQLPQIVKGINFIANEYYAKNKKSICRW